MSLRTLDTPTSLILRSNANPTGVLDESLGYITGLRGLPAPETPPGVIDGGDVGGVDNGEPRPLPPCSYHSYHSYHSYPLPLLSIDPLDQTD